MDLNVFNNYGHPKSWYWCHPFLFIKHTFENWKEAIMRAKKGYCYTDVWNMDSWFCEVMAAMLRDLADKGHAYPGNDEFDTPEKWHDWLYSIADLFESASEEDNNEFFDALMKTSRDNPEYEKVRTLYHEREEEINKSRKVMLISAMQHFSRGIVEGLFWD